MIIDDDSRPYWPNNIDRWPAGGHSFVRPKIQKSFFGAQKLNFIKNEWFHIVSRLKDDLSTNCREADRDEIHDTFGTHVQTKNRMISLIIECTICFKCYFHFLSQIS